MDYFSTRIFFMFLMGHPTSKSCNITMICIWLGILVSIRPWICWHDHSGGLIYVNLSKIMFTHVTYVEQRRINIILVVYYSHYWFRGRHGNLSLYFITNLSHSTRFNAILTIVDRYTKMADFNPYTKDITSEETTNLIIHEVFRHHSLPNNIINDCEPQFISKFWKHLFTMLKVSCKLSSS